MPKTALTKWTGATLVAILLALSTPAGAQKFPDGSPITLVVPYPPGGMSDFFARMLAAKMGESLGTTVIVDNRPGANGSIGTHAVSRSTPSGHTIAFVPASTVTTNQWIMKDMPFDPIKDLTPLALAVVVPNVLVVHPSVPAKSLPELFELIRSKPGQLNYASVGIGSSTHLQAEMLKGMAQLDITHVPYRGAGPALQDLLAGRVQMMFDNLPSVMPLVQAGQLRALAVTSAKPAPLLPDVPPFGNFLPGFEANPWFGLVGPAGLPKDIVVQLNDHIVRGAKSPDVEKAMNARGGEIVTSSPEEFGRLIKEESERMRKLIKDANITAQ